MIICCMWDRSRGNILISDIDYPDICPGSVLQGVPTEGGPEHPVDIYIEGSHPINNIIEKTSMRHLNQGADSRHQSKLRRWPCASRTSAGHWVWYQCWSDVFESTTLVQIIKYASHNVLIFSGCWLDDYDNGNDDNDKYQAYLDRVVAASYADCEENGELQRRTKPTWQHQQFRSPKKPKTRKYNRRGRRWEVLFRDCRQHYDNHKRQQETPKL